MSSTPSPTCNAASLAPPAQLLISPLEGGEEWSPKATKSQLLGFSNDERAERQAGRPEGGARECNVESTDMT